MAIIGIGLDLVEINTLRNYLLTNPSIKQTVFTNDEQRWCDSYFDPIERYSGRFAAKEAFYKALPTCVQNSTDWLDIEIKPGTNGKPEVHPSESCKKAMLKHNISRILISITHESGFAIAIIVLSD